MKYEEFIEQVQQRAHLSSTGEFEDIRAHLPPELYNEFFAKE